jgi:hypothetical protein
MALSNVKAVLGIKGKFVLIFGWMGSIQLEVTHPGPPSVSTMKECRRIVKSQF